MAIKNELQDDGDLRLFKNRLWNLMKKKDKNLDGPRKLATLLYDEGYVLSKKREKDSFNEPSRDKSNAVGSMEKKIRVHLNSDSADCLDGEYVTVYCNIFGCSADYLFGYTDIKSGDIEIRRICEITGLSEEAIVAIKRITDPKSAFRTTGMHAQESRVLMNKLLNAKRLVDFIEGLKHLDDAYLIPNRAKKVEDDLIKKLGTALFREASEWNDKLDESYDGPEPRSELCEAVKMYRETIDEMCEINDQYERDIKVFRYELHEVYTELIDEMYPRSL